MPNSSVTIPSKLPQVGTTIFSVMSKLAAENNAVNLSQGFPDFPVSNILIGLVEKHMRAGHNQYAPMPGVPELRKQISEKVQSIYGVSYDQNDEITVAAGATQAIFTTLAATINQGDEVILFSPSYDCYQPAIELMGGVVRHINLEYPDYTIPWDEVRKTIGPKTKMIIVNSPHNPSGTVFTKSDLDELAMITQDTNIIVLSDEVYEHIIFDGKEHQSVIRHPELRKRSFVIFSFGKTFHATGWKIGYVLSPATMMEEFRKTHQYNVFSCSTPMQYGLADYISNDQHYLGLSDFFQKKRDLFLEHLGNSRFEYIKSSGTYFQVLNYSKISDQIDTDLAINWTVKHKIASIPISVFYPNHLDQKVLRFCFAKKDETIVAAAKILSKL